MFPLTNLALKGLNDGYVILSVPMRQNHEVEEVSSQDNLISLIITQFLVTHSCETKVFYACVLFSAM